MTEQTKQNPVAVIKKSLKKHERKILITATVVSTGYAMLMRSGVAQHNDFLRQHDLFEKFYDMPAEIA